MTDSDPVAKPSFPVSEEDLDELENINSSLLLRHQNKKPGEVGLFDLYQRIKAILHRIHGKS